MAKFVRDQKQMQRHRRRYATQLQMYNTPICARV